jgi:hypothetical protein
MNNAESTATRPLTSVVFSVLSLFRIRLEISEEPVRSRRRTELDYRRLGLSKMESAPFHSVARSSAPLLQSLRTRHISTQTPPNN